MSIEETLGRAHQSPQNEGMDKAQFNIFDAIRNAYLFVGRNWLYLLKIGMLPVLMQIGVALFLQSQRPDASTIESYLWGLPATTLFSWFMFLEMRLLLLGERIDKPLPKDINFLRDRQRALRVSIITALLFNMWLAASVTLLLAATDSGLWGVNWPLTLAGLFLIGSIVWGMRFSVLPILGAVDHPFKPFLDQVRGMMFSLRLIGMGILCLLPVAFVFQILTALFISRPADPAVPFKLSDAEQIGVLIAGAPLSLIVSALLNAAAAYALKQLLGARKNGVIA